MNKPDGDGIDHINIYSKGKTSLGRFLSNWTFCPIELPEGNFNSIEGYWYWLGNHDDRMNIAYGYTAKKLGREILRTIMLDEVIFQDKIKFAINIKIKQDPIMLDKFIKSTLPFTHYYCYGDVVREAGYEWIVDHIEKLRTEMKKYNENVICV